MQLPCPCCRQLRVFVPDQIDRAKGGAICKTRERPRLNEQEFEIALTENAENAERDIMKFDGFRIENNASLYYRLTCLSI